MEVVNSLKKYIGEVIQLRYQVTHQFRRVL